VTEQPEALVSTSKHAMKFGDSIFVSERRMLSRPRPWRYGRVREWRRSDGTGLGRMRDTLLSPWIAIVCNGERRWQNAAGDVDQR